MCVCVLSVGACLVCLSLCECVFLLLPYLVISVRFCVFGVCVFCACVFFVCERLFFCVCVFVIMCLRACFYASFFLCVCIFMYAFFGGGVA